VKIAVDAMGGDFAPEQIVLGSVQAAKKFHCDIVLVGDEPKIREVLRRESGWENLGITKKQNNKKRKSPTGENIPPMPFEPKKIRLSS